MSLLGGAIAGPRANFGSSVGTALAIEVGVGDGLAFGVAVATGVGVVAGFGVAIFAPLLQINFFPDLTQVNLKEFRTWV